MSKRIKKYSALNANISKAIDDEFTTTNYIGISEACTFMSGMRGASKNRRRNMYRGALVRLGIICKDSTMYKPCAQVKSTPTDQDMEYQQYFTQIPNSEGRGSGTWGFAKETYKDFLAIYSDDIRAEVSIMEEEEEEEKELKTLKKEGREAFKRIYKRLPTHAQLDLFMIRRNR